MIECACGCGQQLEPRDDRNRPRRFVWGHHSKDILERHAYKKGREATGTPYPTGHVPWNKGKAWPEMRGANNPSVKTGKGGFKKGYTPWNKGLNWTPPNVESLVEAGKKNRYKKGQMAKEKHPKWKGGITPINNLIRNSPEYKKWRGSVFRRDKYTCVNCGKVGGDLVADHYPYAFHKYPEKRLILANGRTLCKVCNHKSTHILREWSDGINGG